MAAKVIEVLKEQELRIEVDTPVIPSSTEPLTIPSTITTTAASGITVILQEGTCECFGTELAQRQPYTFPPGHKFALFTWHGCRLSIEDIAEKTPMPSYIMLHEKLEETRNLAAKNPNIPGPVLIIAGPVDSGKSTLARTLLSWAVRAGNKPFFVDLDIGQGEITIPGVISTVLMEKPPSVIEGINGCKSSPIALNFGHISLDKNPSLYRAIVQNLEVIIREKMELDPISKRSGMIVNTCGWIEGLGYDLLLHLIKAFKADVVAVIDNERLLYSLKEKDLKDHPEIDVQMLPKSGGVIARNNDFRRKARLNRIREYFYGQSNELCPHSTIISFSDVKIYKLGGTPAAPSSVLPIGQASQYDPLCAMEVTPSIELSHSVLAILYCSDPSEIIQANIAGFIYISKVDMEKKAITILAPCPGQLPSKILVHGSLKWLE